MAPLPASHPTSQGGRATDIDAIDRQGGRILGLIARMGNRLDPDDIKTTHPEVSELDVTRPDGERVRVLQLPAMVDGQRLQTELLAALAGSTTPVPALLARAAKVTTRADADRHLLDGGALIFHQGRTYALQLRSIPTRNVDEPTTERAVFGPKDAFVESMEMNIALIRSHLRDPLLVAQRVTLGTEAPTQLAVLYREGAADPSQLDDILSRLSRYQAPRVGFVSSLLRPLYGSLWSPFLPADFTERPYRAADLLFRGRFAILVDGSPYAMLLPVSFVDLFVDEEEYLQSSGTRYFVRVLRFLAFVIAIFGPGLYIAVLSVNTTVMPGLLAIAVAANRQSLAFPILTETILMLVVLDIMAEATTAMKGVLGPAISIVGSLIVGQAAVRANLASNLGVILLALTALATFITPRYQLTYATRVWKYVFLLVSGVLGLVGWSVGVVWLAINLSATRELGSHYLAPLAPLLPRSWDTTSPLQRPTPTVPFYVRRTPRRS